MNSENNIIYPSIERTAEMSDITCYTICDERNSMDAFRDIPEEEMPPYIKSLRKEAEGTGSGLKKVIISADSEPVAVKCAKYLLTNEAYMRAYKDLKAAEDGNLQSYGVYYDDILMDDYDISDSDLKLVKFGKTAKINEVPVNIYVKILDGVESDAIIYEGLQSGCDDLSDMIYGILSKNAECSYIWITPDVADAPWVTELRMRYGYDLFNIEEPTVEYYEQIFEKLLDEEGCHLAKDLTVSDMAGRIMKLRGASFSEEDLEWMIKRAVIAHGKTVSNEPLTLDDFAISGNSQRSAYERLESMPALSDVKEMITEQVALLKERRRNKSLSDMHGSMIFYGNPGTAKTTCAMLLAEIMADSGITGASFTAASRADIIGQYVGATAVKVSALFDKARGGVLFVDEAGFFLNTGAGGYVNEALKEFVRFMELYPDVTVVFAMYEREAEEFLSLDEGLASRISRMIEFRDYTSKEMIEIFKYMAREKGYSVEFGVSELINGYLNPLKKEKSFGNAREVRKLMESSIIAHSVRISGKSAAKKDVLTTADVAKGIDRIRKTPKKKEFGFRYCTEGSGALRLNTKG